MPPMNDVLPRRWLRWVAVVLLWLILPQLGSAAAPILVERLDVDVPERAAAAVIAGQYDDDFVAQPYAAFTPSRQHGVWYRVRLVADWTAPRPPVLSVFDPQGLLIRAYLPPAYEAVTASIYDVLSSPGFTRHSLAFILPDKLPAHAPVYFHVAPERAVARRIVVADIRVAHTGDLAHAQLDVLFPAIQLATLLVMLSFFVALRERMYGYFVGHVLFLVFYELYEFGIGYTLAPFDWLAPLKARPVWLSAALAGLLLCEFSRVFLDLGRTASRLDRVLSLARWPLLALAVCAAIPPLSQGWWVEDVLALLFAVLAPLLVVSGLVAWQHGSRRAGFYLCAWIPGLLFVVVRVLQLILRWPLPSWLEFALPAAFAFASVVQSFGLADYTLSIRHERDVAKRLAERDGLTGALNRRAILAHLRAAFQRARDSSESLALLFLDLDHFKRINDGYGHRAGDQCLRAVVDPIASELRQGDALGRYGGEEFLVVLPGATAANAEVVAERIRARVEAMTLLVSGTRIDVTLSVGIADADAAVASPEDLIERADAALYRAKSRGRNQVSSHPAGAPLQRDVASGA